METMQGIKRTDYCGTLTAKDIGREVTLCGWVQRQRDLGALIFVDLRDRTGVVQLAFTESTDKEVFDKAFSVRSEYVLAAIGTVRERSAKNPDIPTGEIEIEWIDNRVTKKARRRSTTRCSSIIPIPASGARRHSPTTRITR